MSEPSSAFKIEPVVADNYATWSIRMRALLEHKDLWDVVKLGQGVVPEGADAARQAAAERQDRKARTLIILNVADQHLALVNKKTTAKSVWDALENLYRSKSTARRQQLRRSLAGL
jgi:hypothetical protein